MRNTMEAAVPAALPAWNSVLAVVAHPDDESFGLGALLDAFVQAGSAANVLCFTRGEASTLQGVPGDLTILRAQEFERAADILGVWTARLGDHPDGALDAVDRSLLVSEIETTVDQRNVDGLLVFDPSGISGHPDHIAATAAAVTAAERLGLPVLSWSLPESVAQTLNDEFAAGFIGHASADIDLIVPVNRDRQREASLAHASQALPTSVLWRRLELLGDFEHLRLLRTAGLGTSVL